MGSYLQKNIKLSLDFLKNGKMELWNMDFFHCGVIRNLASYKGKLFSMTLLSNVKSKRLRQSKILYMSKL